MINYAEKNAEGKINIFEDFTEKLQKEMAEMGHANIIISGKTGVGKSTLINAAFREKLAETGMGRPVTKSCKLIEKTDFPLRIYDTVGLELNSITQAEAIEEIKSLIKAKINEGNPDHFIHCLWYCIQSDSDRFEDAEKAFITEISEIIPVVLVLTKAYFKKHAESFKSILHGYNLPVKNIVIVLAERFEEDDCIRSAFGVDTLVEFTKDLLPKSAQKAWINAQQASIEMKKDHAHKIVLATAAGSFGAGFAPLPFSDCLAIAPIQIGMIAKITSIFGVKMNKAAMGGFVTSLVGTSGATFAGRVIVSNLFKLIPGIGTAVGGAISGTTAALLTTALGKTYIAFMEMMAKNEVTPEDLENEDVQYKIKKVFKENLN